jgi:hypothetical protein
LLRDDNLKHAAAKLEHLLASEKWIDLGYDPRRNKRTNDDPARMTMVKKIVSALRPLKVSVAKYFEEYPEREESTAFDKINKVFTRLHLLSGRDERVKME